MILLKPAELLERWNRGMLAEGEFVTRLIEAAATNRPEEFMPLITSVVLDELRATVSSPPSSHEKAPRSFAIGTFSRAKDESERRAFEVEDEARIKQEQVAYFKGAWNWHRYFNEIAAPSGL